MNHKSLNNKELKTYTKLLNSSNTFDSQPGKKQRDNKVPLSTQNAVKYLLQGTLRLRVCRYCLNVTSKLSEFDEVLTLAVSGSLHEVTIRDIVASFHPYKVVEDKNFPNKICTECVNRAISCYLFTQQCDRAERALRNCFDDIHEKFEKLDTLEPVKKRGKRKLNPNHNLIYAEHKNVMNYAQPVINIVNVTNELVPQNNNEISELECQKCWQVLPNIESLVNHENSHPKSMWFNCRLCGKSFVKRSFLKRHIKGIHTYVKEDTPENTFEQFKCNECGILSKTLGEHLLHNEKHQFKRVFDCIIERKFETLCSVCFNKSSRLTNLSDVVHVHGGYSGLNGDKSIGNIVTSTIPGITLDNCTGTKICEKCFNHAISAYVFISKILHARSRLNTCVSVMLEKLDAVGEPNGNLMVEISENIILPSLELDEVYVESLKDCDEWEYDVEVLEDEFRVESSSESYDSDDTVNDMFQEDSFDDDTLYNPAKHVTRTYSNKRLVNGYQTDYDDSIFKDVCSEFLTFKKKLRRPTHIPKYRYTCPLCNKHFISDYFLKKHVLKHVYRKVRCNICSSDFKSKFYLFEHKKTDHVMKLQRYLTCKTCGRTFSGKDKMRSHQRSHRIKECQLCDKLFVSQKHYDVHMRRHAVKFNANKNKHLQTCSFCEKCCSNENELSLHVNRTHLQIKPYSCDMCNRQFYTESNLCSHKKLHNLLSTESCAFCNKVFKCRKHLVIHVRKHIGIKPHICPVCRKSFYSDSNMKKHMRIFHGGIYCCRLCRMVLPSQLDLRSHINLTHSSM